MEVVKRGLGGQPRTKLTEAKPDSTRLACGGVWVRMEPGCFSGWPGRRLCDAPVALWASPGRRKASAPATQAVHFAFTKLSRCFTAAVGPSFAPNTAVPATNTLAPARDASPI